MNPNKPLNRETLLRIVHQSLERQSAARSGGDGQTTNDGSDGNDGTLGVVVRQILTAFSPESLTVENQNVNAIPVPLHEVAAYVDGTLADPTKQDEITEAAITDPGLMMEIVSAIRSRADAVPEQALSTDLRARLIALQSQPVSQSAPEADSVASPPHETSRSAETAQTNQPRISVAKAAPALSGKTNFNWLPAAAFVTAAALFFGIGWWVRSGMAPESSPIAEDPNAVQSTELAVPSGEDQSPDDSGDSGAVQPMLVEQPNLDVDSSPDPIDLPNAPIDLTPEMPSPGESPSTKLAGDTVPNGGPSPDVNVRNVPDPLNRMTPPELPAQLRAQKKQLVAEWTQIDGLLLRSVSSMTPQASRSGDLIPASVVTGNTFELASESIDERLRLQTLPLCRATAKLAGGGELVLAADTQVDVTLGGALDLRFGSFAIMGLNDQSVVHLGRNVANSVSLQSESGGSIVVRKTLLGMEVDVGGKPVEVDGKTFVDSRLKVEGRVLAATRIDDAPERLPRWTRQRVDRIEVGRNVLGQLSASTNVRATIIQSLRSGSVRGAEAATLRGWLVATSGDNLLRLISMPDAQIREAALQHLRAVNPTDPRHRALWQGLQSRGNNQRTFTSVRSYFIELWAGRRPNVTRRDHLLQMLQAPDGGARVTANYLLRSFYGPGPRFDLNASPTARTRTIAAWRAVINRVD